MNKWGKLRGIVGSAVLGLVVSLIPAPSLAAGPVGNILLYSGSACAENSSQRIYFCLDFRNESGGYDVDFEGSGMRFDWSIETQGQVLDSGGSLVRYGMRTGTPASWGFHRQEVNGLSAGTTYLVTLTVDNGGTITQKTLSVATTGTASPPPPEPTRSPEPSSSPEVEQEVSESPEVTNPPSVALGAVTVRAASQMNGGETLTVTIGVRDTNDLPMPGENVTLFSTGPGSLSTLTATTNASGNATVEFTAPADASGFATIYATVGSQQQLKSIEISPRSSETRRFGGYAVVHPDTNHVCGVIGSNGANTEMTSAYMGCPIGSKLIFQTKPSPTGNVAGWHGVDVIYRDGTFYLPGGTTIRDGIATDVSGRVWDTGTGETLVSGSQENTPGASAPSSASPTTSDSASTDSNELEADEPVSEQAPLAPEEIPTVALNTSEQGVSIVVENAVGKRLSAKIAGRWLVENVDVSPFTAFRPLVPGSEVVATVWLDGILIDSKTFNSGEAATNSPVSASKPVQTSSPEVVTESTQVASLTSVEIETSGSAIEFKIDNAQGKRVSIKIGGRWIVERPESNSFSLSTSSVAGNEVDILIYVDGALVGQSTIEVGQSAAVSIQGKESQRSSSATSSPKSGSEQSTSSAEITLDTSDAQILITALNAEGRKLSLKVGGRWLVVYPDSNNFTFRTASSAGAVVTVSKFIDSELFGVETITVSD